MRAIVAKATTLAVGWSVAVLAAALAGGQESLPDTASAPARLEVILFVSPTCAACHKVEAALPGLLTGLDDRIQIIRRDVSQLADYEIFIAMGRRHQINQARIPAVFVGRRSLVGAEAIVGELREAIQEQLRLGSAGPPEPSGDPDSDASPRHVGGEVQRRFQEFKVGMVALAGLVDGVNPCAFTTIVFLLSMLAYLGRTRRQIGLVGVGFTVAVFVTYLLLGLGLLGAIKVISVSRGISAGINYAVGLLAVVLAIWSFVDYVRFSASGDAKTITLGLPEAVKARIRKVIRVGLSGTGLLVSSVVVGFVVAILESLCTGQVYLPTIVFMTRMPGTGTHALAYLVLYNLMFILPLAVVMAVAYMGVRSETMRDFFRRHLAGLKLALSLLFGALGVLLIATA